MHILENEERWFSNGSLNYYTILQIELYFLRNKKAVNSLFSIWVSHSALSENQTLGLFSFKN